MIAGGNEVYFKAEGSSAYIPGIEAAVITEPRTTRLFAGPDRKPVEIMVKGMKDPREMVPWGENNDLPSQLIDKAYKLPQMTSNLGFNIVASYGDGIRPVRILEDGDRKKVVPYAGNKEVESFFEENDINGYLLEQLTDMYWFFNVFPEIIFNREDGQKRKIVEIHSKEAVFSRWARMDAQGRIPWHYYFAYWGEKQPDEDEFPCMATPVLDPNRTVQHLRRIMEEDASKSWEKRRNRFIVPVSFPTPGRSYYAKPYWYSIIESGWYDFAIQIPVWKKAVMNNQLGIRYVVVLDGDYFPEIRKVDFLSGDIPHERDTGPDPAHWVEPDKCTAAEAGMPVIPVWVFPGGVFPSGTSYADRGKGNAGSFRGKGVVFQKRKERISVGTLAVVGFCFPGGVPVGRAATGGEPVPGTPDRILAVFRAIHQMLQPDAGRIHSCLPER